MSRRIRRDLSTPERSKQEADLRMQQNALNVRIAIEQANNRLLAKQTKLLAKLVEQPQKVPVKPIPPQSEAEESASQDLWNIPPAEMMHLVQRCRESQTPISGELDKCRFEDFKRIMHQLSIEPNFYVTPESYQHAEIIFKSHFADPREPTDSNQRINWLGTGPAYRDFHKLLVDTKRIQNNHYAAFFAAHYTKKGERVNIEKTRQWARVRRQQPEKPSKDAENLKNILSD